MSGVVCAIHQPNFFPWLGYFDKIRRADVFVFMDAVALPRTGAGSWTNRVRLMVGGEARWVGSPLRKAPPGAAISSIEIDDGQPWREKLLRTLDFNYRKAARFAETMTLLEPLIRAPEQRIAEFNIAAIRVIANQLKVGGRFVRESDMGCDRQSTQLLIDLTRAAGGDVYLAGGGASGYQEDELFARSGVALRYQNFTPLPYGPPDRFTPGLSVIDYLMHDGRPLAEAFPAERAG